MMTISAWSGDLSDQYLKQIVQLGADYIDFGYGDAFPGVKEQGYPDLDALLKIRRRVRSWGLDINRVTLPDVTERLMKGLPGGEIELENTCNALKVFGEAGIPIARQRFAGDTFENLTTYYQAVHRGGILTRGESLGLTEHKPATPTAEELQDWWTRFLEVYGRLVPIAEEYKVKLAIHPSDTPNIDTPFGGLGFHRVIDAFPSKQVGFLYCIGTRAEAGGSALVLDELTHYGRKGKIFLCHFRNVRGSLATAGGFEEALLDDGDMNMFKFILALHKVGFSGCINPDHIPILEGDGSGASLGLAYSIGYIKAMLAALAGIA
ncbi:MAG: mannonate dehydratase [Candidatus Latescibacteria bacterium]|nr:mannonate dehydratase [Candidatus Latescibacterota bacterium]